MRKTPVSPLPELNIEKKGIRLWPLCNDQGGLFVLYASFTSGVYQNTRYRIDVTQ